MRRLVLVILAGCTALATACSSSTSGSPNGSAPATSAGGFPSSSAPSSSGLSSSGPSSAPSSTAPTSTAPTSTTPTTPAPTSTLSDASFLPPAEIAQGFVLVKAKIAAEQNTTGNGPDDFAFLGCLDIDNVKSPGKPPKGSKAGAAEYASRNSPGVYAEVIAQGPSVADSRALVRASAKSLRRCSKPVVTIQKIRFTGQHTALTTGAAGCSEAVGTETVATGRASNGSTVALDITTYVVARGYWVAYLVGYEPVINGDALTAGNRASAMCARLPR